ncbi:phage tail protein [Methylobacter sp. G7]|uniref:phage tail protein n=1 Tax=Methylobacter sp. G7 TaxID=3230117 RepID=UPI003D80594D
MKKIADLHSYLLSLDVFAAEQLNSEVDDLTITPAYYPDGANVVVCEQSYTAMFFIERYAHAKVSTDVLFAHISRWLMENDTGSTAPLPFTVIVDVLDHKTANLEFGIRFNENITAVADVNGTLLINGVKYALT